MSKLHLINEIQTAIKMATVNGESLDNVKLAHNLDDLLSNYKVEEREEEYTVDDNDDYIQMYLNAIQVENYAQGTLEGYHYELRSFANFVQKPLLKVKTADIRQYIAVHGHLKMSSVTTKLNKISSFYSWLVREEELLKNPCDRIGRPKLPKKVREGLTLIELEQVRAACIKIKKVKGKKNEDTQVIEVDIRKRALVEVFYSTACRLDELRRLNREDIDWGRNSVIVRGKGDKERRVYLSEKAVYYLKQYLETRDDDCPALFASDREFDGTKRRLTHEGIQYQIKQIKKLSGIEKPLSPHIFRHSFAQIGLDNGMDLSDLQALLGHENPATTMRYAQVSEERKLTAFKKFHVQ